MELKNLEKSKKINVNDSFIVNALRNCGYNNYSAISDIVDNSIEPNVGSTFVKIDFDVVDNKITSIYIIDNGCGMNRSTLKEAMTIGSETGKTGEINLGKYGAGLKTAAFSFGKKLEVYTKTKNEELLYSMISIEDFDKTKCFDSQTGIIDNNSDIYNWFIKSVNGQNGTIIKISALDKVPSSNYQYFKNQIYNKISENFNKYIFANLVDFYIVNEKVLPTDMMSENLNSKMMSEGKILISNNSIKYKTWFVAEGLNGLENDKKAEEHIIKNNIYTIPVSRSSQGLYIYRQNRLIGKGLLWDMWTRDRFSAPLRIEIFVDGNSDDIFGSTFTKMIGESAKNNISEELYNSFCAEFGPIATEVRKQMSAKYEKIDTENLSDLYDDIIKQLNKNKMLAANRRQLNTTPKNPNPKKRGPQINPNPHKESKWIDGIKEIPLGQTGVIYDTEHIDGKIFVVINIDHAFYKKLFVKLSDSMKTIMAKMFACEEIAKQKCNYYVDDEIANSIDCFKAFQSEELYKAINF